MRTTPKMGLVDANIGTDAYSFEALDSNLQKIDLHDHSEGKGVQIPMEGIAPGAVGINQLAPSVQSALVVPGFITLWPTTALPVGYLACDGGSWPNSFYPNLYVALGNTTLATIYGQNLGASTFQVPFIVLSGPPYGQLQYIIKY